MSGYDDASPQMVAFTLGGMEFKYDEWLQILKKVICHKGMVDGSFLLSLMHRNCSLLYLTIIYCQF
ncbi:MAG: hypothetical protein J1E98_14860 [Lachnospiraceae bacterium]|nr:hypothetical protein [Lachnospiraceae bacterium]